MPNGPSHTAQHVTPHSAMAKVFHWGFIVVFVYGLTKQVDEVEELEDVLLLHNEMLFAALFLLLLLVRFVYMRSTRATALPLDTPPHERRLARVVHVAMYASLAGIALTGLGIGGLYMQGVKGGGLMEVLLLVHEVAVHATYVLIAGHVAAALYHRRRRDGLWESMLPEWLSGNRP